MRKISLKKQHKVNMAVLLLSALLLILTGCGKNAELENYKANMNQFFENIRIIDASINAIDANSETSTTELLSLLDSMDTSFAQMAALEVPDGFPGVAELADDASEYMTEAVSCYHQAYDGEYDAAYEEAAYRNYEQANIRFQYIVSIIHGNIPEEIFTYEDQDDLDEDEVEDNDNGDVGSESSDNENDDASGADAAGGEDADNHD